MTSILVLLALASLPAQAAQPAADGPGGASPLRHWDVTALRLDLTVDPLARTVAGTATLDVRPLGLPDDHLRLDQVGLQIEAVTVDGVPAAGLRIGDDDLVIPVTPGMPHTVAVTYTATPDSGVHFRRGDGPHGITEAWTQGEEADNRHWFPGWDHPSDTFPVTTSLTVPDALVAVANGVLEAKEPAARAGWTRWTYRLDQPIVTYLVAFAVGAYDVYTDDADVPYAYVVPKGTPESVARAGLGQAPAIGAYLSKLLGHPYPYAIYRQVTVQRFMYAGMENASLTVLADDLLVHDQELGLESTERVVAHELAHQWFGDLLTTKGWSELWLNEGFATYYAARWAESSMGEEEYAAQVLGWSAPARSTGQPMARRAWSKPDASPYNAQYVRGATVLHMLRAWLGTDLYDTAIRAYVADHAFSLVETADLRQAFEDATGNDLRWFFDPLVHGWGAPRIDSRWSLSDGTLTVTLDQSGDAPPWLGPVRVDWGDTDGTVHTEHLWLSTGTTQLRVPATGVSWVAPDPVGGVLATWTRHQDTAAWAAQLAGAITSHARLVATEALADPKGQLAAAVPVLAETLLGGHRLAPATDAVRDTQRLARRAAASLGALATPEARDALLAGLQSPSTTLQLRADILSALGSFPLDDTVRGLLNDVIRRDPSPDLGAAALRSLAAIQPSDGLAAARAILARSDTSREGNRVAAALAVVADHGVERDLANVQRWADDPRRDVQHGAGRAAVNLARHEDVNEVRREGVARTVIPWLDSEDQRTRRVAILLLAQLGQPAAIPPLRMVAAQSTLPDHREAARAAIIQIRAAVGGNEDPDALVKAQATIDALQERIDELARRVDKLEAW